MIDRTLFGRTVPHGAMFAAALMLWVSFVALSATSAAEPLPAQAIRLEPAGPARQLPPEIAGASSEPMIERLIGNQAKTAALREIAPAVLRFPGGSQANFYDWKTGLLDFHGNSQSSPYVKFWAQIALKISVT